jgi:zinc protease
LRAEIARIAREGVAADELARARAQLVASQIYKLDSMFAQAMEIGQLEAAGIPYQSNTRMIEKLQAVTAEQVRAVAQKYFRDEQLTVAELDPQPLPQAPRPRSAPAGRH